MVLASSKMTIKLNRREIAKFIGPTGPVYDEVRRVVRLTVNGARIRAGVLTGRLTSSIDSRIVVTPTAIIGTVFSKLEYAAYHHQGTGLRGPRHRMIVPVRAKALRWKGRGGWVFAMKSRGSAPNPFLVKALKAASPWPVNEHVRA